MKSGFAGVGQDNHDTPGRTSASLLDAYHEAHFQNPSLKRSCSSPKERNRHVPDRIGTKEVIPPMAEMRPHRERQADRQTYYKVVWTESIDRVVETSTMIGLDTYPLKHNTSAEGDIIPCSENHAWAGE
jgi:hypothetical protein